MLLVPNSFENVSFKKSFQTIRRQFMSFWNSNSEFMFSYIFAKNLTKECDFYSLCFSRFVCHKDCLKKKEKFYEMVK